MSEEQEVMDSGALSVISRAEFDTQIATAKRYPRSPDKARKAAESLALTNEDTAKQCYYRLERKSKDGGRNVIEGPSIRLAEIIACSWGNIRYGSRVLEVGEKFVTAQGVAHDLESNAMATEEVQRRITDKGGRRYGDDMIVVTANAARSIAMRNALLRVVPRPYVDQIMDKCRQLVRGDIKTLPERRQKLLGWLKQILGVGPERVLFILDKKSVADIGLDDLERLHALAQAVKDGETTVEAAFPDPDAPDPAETAKEKLAAALAKPAKPADAPAPAPEPEVEPSSQQPEPPEEVQSHPPDESQAPDPVADAMSRDAEDVAASIRDALERFGKIQNRAVKEGIIRSHAAWLNLNVAPAAGSVECVKVMTLEQRVALFNAIKNGKLGAATGAINS